MPCHASRMCDYLRIVVTKVTSRSPQRKRGPLYDKANLRAKARWGCLHRGPRVVTSVDPGSAKSIAAVSLSTALGYICGSYSLLVEGRFVSSRVSGFFRHNIRWNKSEIFVTSKAKNQGYYCDQFIVIKYMYLQWSWHVLKGSSCRTWRLTRFCSLFSKCMFRRSFQLKMCNRDNSCFMYFLDCLCDATLPSTHKMYPKDKYLSNTRLIFALSGGS